MSSAAANVSTLSYRWVFKF